MAVSNDFLQFILDQLALWGGVSAKRMFGGAALYKDELAFGMIARDILYLKVDDSNREEYINAGAHQLKPFKNSATVLSFYSVSLDVLEDSDELISKTKQSLAIQKQRNNIY